MNPFERTFQQSALQIEQSIPKAEEPAFDLHNPEAEQTIQAVNSYKKGLTEKRQKRIPSQKLILSARHDIQSIVCMQTGVVSGILFPAIPNKALEWTSPFGEYKVCRGIAQEGRELIQKLDSQILAALFLTTASHYDLIRSPLGYSGVEKNALLRTVDRIALIDAVLLIENAVNTANNQFLPVLSLEATSEVLTGGFHGRFIGWLQAITEAIHKPILKAAHEKSESSENGTSVSYISKIKKQKSNLKKEFREWKKSAKEDIQDLFTENKIGQKFRTYLMAFLSEENLREADESFVSLVQTKLEQLDDGAATQLAEDIGYFFEKFSDSVQSSYEEQPTFSEQPLGSSLQQTEQEEQEEQMDQVEEGDEVQQGTIPSFAQSTQIPGGNVEKLSWADRIRAKRAAQQQNGEQQ